MGAFLWAFVGVSVGHCPLMELISLAVQFFRIVFFKLVVWCLASTKSHR